MAQTPKKYSLDLDQDLDRSVQSEQDSGFKRDSDIGRFSFQNDQEHHFNEVGGNTNNTMGDSQFSQQGVFSYDDDYRMRQSMKSDEECELEDISGNADMTDRRASHISLGKQQQNQFSGVKIVQRYQSKQEPTQLGQFKYSQQEKQRKSSQVQVYQNAQQQPQKDVQQQQLKPGQQETLSQMEHQHATNKQTYDDDHSVVINNNNNYKTEQLAIVTEQTVLQNIPSTQQLPQNVQSNTNIDQPSTIVKTPQKQSLLTTQQQTIAPQQQWSNQSNKSFSPIVQPDLYNKLSINSIKDKTLISINKQQQPIKLKIVQQTKQQKTPQKLKITLVKQSLIVQQKPASSIRDWFRASNTTTKNNQQKHSKQYNPNTNQIPSPVKQHKQLDPKEKYRRQMQADMKGFQQSLSQFQKNNTNKTTQVNKQRQKANKTHLPQTLSKNAFNNIPQPASQDLRMLLKICVQKKKQNYAMVRQWDKKRAQTMNLHRNVIQMLQNQIDKRIKSSLQNFQIYSNFFKQKLRQQEKFTTSPVINTKYALQNNSISKNIYINCSVILNSLSEQNQAKCKKVQDFITLIKNDILKDLIETHMHDSKFFVIEKGQRQLLKVRQKISTLKSSLKKYNTETEQKSQQLARLFTQATISVRPNNDFYSSQLQFLRSASQQVFIQKRLGENCLQYYHTALNQEFKRAKVIREALLTYSKGLKQTYNIELEQVGLQQLSKTQQIKLIEQFYSLDEMFDQRTGQMLKQRFSLPLHEDLTISQVTKFIQTFQYETFNNRMLLLKEFSAKYYASVNKDFKTPREQNCHIVITVDFYLHLFFSPDKSSLKPDISLKITPKQLEIKPQRQQFIDIIKKQEKRPSMISYFWQSKNQKVYRVKFPSKDNKELFYDYLNKLLS